MLDLMPPDFNKMRDRIEAKAMLTKLEAVLVLLENNDLAAEIHIAGLVVGMSVNSRLKDAVYQEKLEIMKYLAGKSNSYE